jgi:geranylgeranyl diphosphate synthase type I
VNLTQAANTYLPMIEGAMREVVRIGDSRVAGHFGMMQYHLGWLDEFQSPILAPSGKRIRPLLCLLSCGAAGADPKLALPAATGVELLHNFSLIHDDIEDDSPTRRHRPTVWKLFGVPQACNAGDGMFSLAHLALHRLRDQGIADGIVLEALKLFDETCLALTEGQYLDMTFETRRDVSVDEYFRMIAAKTGALLAASSQLGALVAGARRDSVEAYRAFGAALGRAFQLQDDILGIWGDEHVTGKSAASDILGKKKSLPVIYALSFPGSGERLEGLYRKSTLTDADMPEALSLLDEAGARLFVEKHIDRAVGQAHEALRTAQSQADAGFLPLLAELLDSLVGRVT